VPFSLATFVFFRRPKIASVSFLFVGLFLINPEIVHFTRFIDGLKIVQQIRLNHSMVDALNFFDGRRRVNVVQYAVTLGTQNVYHILLRRKD
jgi:hypothetical protein